MKKILSILTMVVCFPFFANAAEVIVETHQQTEKIITLAWTADTDGTVDYTLKNSFGFGKVIYMVVTDPGATSPTDNYDITLTDSNLADVMGGALSNRDEATTEQAMPLVGGAYQPRKVFGSLVLSIANNGVDSATGTIIIYYTMFGN